METTFKEEIKKKYLQQWTHTRRMSLWCLVFLPFKPLSPNTNINNFDLSIYIRCWCNFYCIDFVYCKLLRFLHCILLRFFLLIHSEWSSMMPYTPFLTKKKNAIQNNVCNKSIVERKVKLSKGNYYDQSKLYNFLPFIWRKRKSWSNLKN